MTSNIDRAELLPIVSDAPGKQDNVFVRIVKSKFTKNKNKQEQARVIHINDPASNAPFKFRNNNVKTAKYTPLFFIPKNLYEQFRRLANLYFAFIAALQLIPGLSPTGKYTTLVPLVIVMTLTMLKDAFEDLKRHKSDFEVNNSKTTVLRGDEFIEQKWRDLKVGDIVKIHNSTPFPADLLVICTSDAQGLCYVETSSLDGETNLKIKKARNETCSMSEEDAKRFRGTITCEAPNKSLYTFEGKLELPDGRTIPLDVDQVLLRGSSLRNTSWVIGVVLFTGHDTKLMKNSTAAPSKRSKVEKLTNRQIAFIFCLQILLCIFGCIATAVMTDVKINDSWYLTGSFARPDESRGQRFLKAIWAGAKTFFSFLILFNNLIPISLYVSMELAKLAQAYLIGTDLAMYHEATDTPANANTSALNEELGQVSFIFSDKTGTLTDNRMEFLKFSVSGIAYGKGTTEIGRAAAKRTGQPIVEDEDIPPMSERGYRFYDERIINQAWTKQPNAEEIKEFLTLLAVCHTVIPERDKENPEELIYQASSPDELALVTAAKDLGFYFHSRTNTHVTINVLGKDESYEILNVLEFNSDRKRMSVVCRNPEGKLILYCKGADNVIYARLSENARNKAETLANIEQFAAEGLRTLICAKLELDEEEYKKWAAIHHEASVAIVDRTKKLDEAGELIERNMELVGATAIEDKLQDGVPDTIAQLAKAGIKIWVLTGDKQETAINIGYACSLLDNDMHVVVLETENNTKEELEHLLNEKYVKHADLKEPLGVVVPGNMLTMIFEDANMKKTFLDLCMLCKSVICCRVSPSQKADVVRLVRKNIKTAVTLAIGDGANDVSMIQAAHVGVGISGNEGLQAARNSDYSIAQFRFLTRLLLVHGRWNYRKISKLILYSFYKNMALYLVQFWYVIFNAFSGTSVYDKWALTLFNVIFSFAPIMTLAIFDRDVKAKSAEKFSALYRQGHLNKFYNRRVFLIYSFNAIFHSLVCFFIPMLCFTDFSNGQNLSLGGFGIEMYTAVLLVITLKCAIETSSHTVFNALALIGSVLLWFIFIMCYSLLYPAVPVFLEDLYSVYFNLRVMGTPTFWLVCILCIFISLIRDFSWKFYNRLTARKLYHAVQKADAKKRELSEEEYMMKYFPMEEVRMSKQESKSGSGLLLEEQFQEIKTKAEAMLRHIQGPKPAVALGSSYRGFAFSEDEQSVSRLQALFATARQGQANKKASAAAAASASSSSSSSTPNNNNNNNNVFDDIML